MTSSAILKLSLVLTLFAVVQFYSRFLTVEFIPNSTSKPKADLDDASSQIVHWPKPRSVIYGHVHMAKSAGTELNGMMALRFERICGHKGNSYDAVGHNRRSKEWIRQHPGKVMGAYEGLPDLIQDKSPAYNRGRVPRYIMNEVGYHDCDWISNEVDYRFWNKTATELEPHSMELHVPCRGTIEYLLSMCNYGHTKFRCNTTDVPGEIKQCLSYMDRFRHGEKHPNTTLKCFNPIPMEPYIEYMSERLQPRRFVEPYIHRATNKKRNKATECLLTDATLQAQVKEYLIENYPIFQFCDQCMGSENDLLAPKNDTSTM